MKSLDLFSFFLQNGMSIKGLLSSNKVDEIKSNSSESIIDLERKGPGTRIHFFEIFLKFN